MPLEFVQSSNFAFFACFFTNIGKSTSIWYECQWISLFDCVLILGAEMVAVLVAEMVADLLEVLVADFILIFNIGSLLLLIEVFLVLAP